MKQATLVEHFSEQASITRTAANHYLKILLSIMGDALQHGESIPLEGIGKISVGVRKGRKGRNPQTGETIEIAEKTVVRFSPSSTIEARVNQTNA